ncbi:MAG: ABC transporter permease, partial [bacterium]
RWTFLGSLGFIAVPEFIIGMILVILFSTTVLNLFPAIATIPPGETPLSNLNAMVLPIATLVLAVTAYLYRLVRASMIDVLDSEYVQMARLKGLPERVVVWRHALPNALVPMIQASAVVLNYLLGGIIVIEFLFAYPGLGKELADAVGARDLPVIQAVVLFLAAGVIIFNLIADLLTVLLTPRLRTAAQ